MNETPADVVSNAFEVIKKYDHKLVVKINEGSNSNDVLKHFLQEPIIIEGFNEILPSLNEIFIKLVEGTKMSRQFQKAV